MHPEVPSLPLPEMDFEGLTRCNLHLTLLTSSWTLPYIYLVFSQRVALAPVLRARVSAWPSSSDVAHEVVDNVSEVMLPLQENRMSSFRELVGTLTSKDAGGVPAIVAIATQGSRGN